MGNSSTKESRPSSSLGHSRPSSVRHASSQTSTGAAGSSSQLPTDRLASSMYNSRAGRSSRPDLSFLGIGNSDRDAPTVETRRETKAEREARKLEKERAAREKERERSVREEGVDGGYLVTLGTYTGPEDFNKDVVRQLMIERRLAPFWKGLNDHSDTWTEHQLVAAVNGLPIPAADEIPPEEPPRSNNLSSDWNPKSSNTNIHHLTVPITSRSQSSNSDTSMNLSPSHPAFSLPSPTSPIAASTSSSPFFRGRAKTLAALTTSSRNNSQTEMTPQEIQFPNDPYVNGQRIEAFLYKNASECPICFLYYPPYLNKTRCCDQPICSECFVQIKRPDPHPPEHHEPHDPNVPQEPQEDNVLVCEPAACPFCVQPEFGVTYEPPPFRRGLGYAGHHHPLASSMSAMSSSSSLASQGLSSPAPTSRRRTTSLSANNATVITTDKVRPDWAKKLSDARAHALRRAAAATALHNAAYMMGNLQASESRGFVLGRRRRTMFGGDSPSSSGHGTPRHGDNTNLGNVGGLLTAAERAGASGSRPTEGQNDLFPGRHSSRRNRLEDLEELMMMEAIRLSLAAEEERKKKEEKESAKEAKKEEKKKAKEAKKAEKAARKSGFLPAGTYDDSDFVTAGSSVATASKGKAVDRSGGFAGVNPLSEPTSTLNASASREDPQRHLEQSRAQIQSTSSPGHILFDPVAEPASHRSALRNLSNASSSASSFAESLPGSLRQGVAGGFGASASSFEPSPNTSGLSVSRDETPGGTPGTEPMFNFRSLAAVIGDEDEKRENSSGVLHIENLSGKDRHSSESNSSQTRSRGDSGQSSSNAPPQSFSRPPDYVEQSEAMDESIATMRPTTIANGDEVEPAPLEIVPTNASNPYDAKHYGDVSFLDSIGQATR